MKKKDKNKMADALSNNGKQEVEALNCNFFRVYFMLNLKNKHHKQLVVLCTFLWMELH